MPMRCATAASDCCMLLKSFSQGLIPLFVQTDYQSSVNPELCQECGECTERCITKAITLGDGSAVVDVTRCIGCGQCKIGCRLTLWR